MWGPIRSPTRKTSKPPNPSRSTSWTVHLLLSPRVITEFTQDLVVTAAQGLLVNDFGLDAAVLVSGTQNGSLSLNTDGSFTYEPNPGFVGTDSFVYEANDGALNSTPATVTLSITDSAPTVTNQVFTTGLDQPLVEDPNGVLASATADNNDALTAVLVAGPSHGVLDLAEDGTFSYVPNQSFVGTDQFTFQASDGVLLSSVATVTIHVTDTAPTVQNATYSVLHDQILTESYDQGLLPLVTADPNAVLTLSDQTNPATAPLRFIPREGLLINQIPVLLAPIRLLMSPATGF